MPRLAAIYRALSQVRNPAVDQALAAALPTARGAALRGIASAVLERRDAAGERGLVQQFHRLDRDTQSLVIREAGQLFRAIREAASAHEPQAVANAVELIRRAGAAKLAYLMVERLRHGVADQKDAAAGCLLELARRSLDGDATQYLMSAVYEAVAAFGQHRREAVLLAAAELVPRGLRDVIRPLSDTQHAAHDAWQAMLRTADAPAVRRCLILMLARPSLAEAATDGFRCAAATADLGDLVATSHYLALPAAARGLSSLKPCPPPATLPALTGGDSRGIPAILACWPADRAARITALTDLHRHADAAARLGALRALIRLAPRSADRPLSDAIAHFRHDDDTAIARVAVTHLLRTAGADLPRLLADLVSSPHESIRRMAALRLGPRGFTKLWETWPKLDPDRRLVAGRALIKLDPHFHRLLGEKLATGERNARLRALSIINDLGQAAFFEPALIRLVELDDERVASAAVRTLGATTSDAAAAALEAALDHADPRVRANAVEALALREEPDRAPQFAAMMDDPASRPRANAIGAMLRMNLRDGMKALRQMLADPRPAHRASALWLVQAAGVVDVARQVAELAVSDPDRDIQRRARLAVKRLVAVLSPQVAQETALPPEGVAA